MNKIIITCALIGALGLVLPVAAPVAALADKTISTPKTGPKSFSGNNRTITVTRTGSISGGTSGLNVSGNNNRVVNNGSISATSNTSGTPAVGVSMTGGSSSITNTGTIRATSTSNSSSSAVGISQGN
jgi:hypothetical protein